MSFDLNAHKPIIIYPCKWAYTVIGISDEGVRAAVTEIMGDVEHDVRLARRSGQGTYFSFHVNAVVQDEAHRDRLFQALQKHPTVRMVL
jgi:uncharacterized protein